MKAKILLTFLFTLLGSYLIAQTSGYTKVDVAVGDNGEAISTIPINLPKGTILQPTLSLAYSSQGNNGLQGLGVSLSGIFQTITRVPATLAQDGVIDPVDFNALDRFALNGERLVAISGTYGADGSEYRTEQNSFAKIIASGTGTFGPDKFSVYTKDGLILYFVNTTDSRIEAVDANGATTKPLLWLLNRIQDRKGNYLTISYIEEKTNGKSEFRPNEIILIQIGNVVFRMYGKHAKSTIVVLPANKSTRIDSIRFWASSRQAKTRCFKRRRTALAAQFFEHPLNRV